MVFSSLLFVFLFLALNLVSQAALRGVRQKNSAMLIFSMVFFSWARSEEHTSELQSRI